jgi:hypothetical protein
LVAVASENVIPCGDERYRDSAIAMLAESVITMGQRAAASF